MRRVLFWQYWHKRDYNRLGSALTPPSNSGVLMQIVLRGAAAGYEAEHTARIFYPAAELSQTLPDDTADLVLAVAHRYLLLVLVRQNGTTTWVQQRPPQGDARTQEYALCRMLYTMLCGVTGIRPPWGMMTGVRPVRIIHDMRASGATEDEIRARFLDHFACTPEKFALALGIADLQKPVLDAVHGVVCCAACREKGGLAMPLSPAALAALRHVLYCPDKKLYSFTLDTPALRQLGQAAEVYVTAQLERSFRTLDYYKSILPQEEPTYD